MQNYQNGYILKMLYFKFKHLRRHRLYVIQVKHKLTDYANDKIRQ